MSDEEKETDTSISTAIPIDENAGGTSTEIANINGSIAECEDAEITAEIQGSSIQALLLEEHSGLNVSFKYAVRGACALLALLIIVLLCIALLSGKITALKSEVYPKNSYGFESASNATETAEIPMGIHTLSTNKSTILMYFNVKGMSSKDSICYEEFFNGTLQMTCAIGEIGTSALTQSSNTGEIAYLRSISIEPPYTLSNKKLVPSNWIKGKYKVIVYGVLDYKPGTSLKLTKNITKITEDDFSIT